MKEIIDKLENLLQKIRLGLELIKPEAIRTQIKEFEQVMQKPDFWFQAEVARKISQQAANLSSKLKFWEDLLADVQSLLELAQDDKDVADVSLISEIEKQYNVLYVQYQHLELALLMNSKYDFNNAILSIHAGAGGDDAQDWAEMLVRMYTRWAELKNLKFEILEKTLGSQAGIKFLTARIIGEYTYGNLMSEYGVHRLVRLSPFDADHARHTSFALVEVLPELDSVDEVKIADKDLRVDTFASSGAGGQSVNTTNSAVRLVHIPTNTTVTCQNERSQQQNRDTALKILQAKLQKLAVDQRVEDIKDLKGEHKEAAWGNQIRSYVLHPYKLVKDLRTEYEETDPDKVLDGEIDHFIASYLRWRVDNK